MKESDEGISERLKTVRSILGVGQKELASKSGIGFSTYQKYELGLSKPGSEALTGFMRSGINTNWLLTGEGPMLLIDLGNDEKRKLYWTLAKSGTWFFAGDLADLGREGVADLPDSESAIVELALNANWEIKEFNGTGEKDESQKLFHPPQNILLKILRFMMENPYFLENGTKGIPAEEYETHATKLLTTGTSKPPLQINDHISTSTLNDFVFVPQYDVRASAGHGSIIHSEQIVDHLAFKKSWVRSQLGCTETDLALITVKGDSMEPTLSPNDLILIDLRKNYVADNAVYVLQYDGSLLVKRIQRLMNGSVIIKSDNPEYKIEELSADQAKKLNVLGVVVWYGRKM